MKHLGLASSQLESDAKGKSASEQACSVRQLHGNIPFIFLRVRERVRELHKAGQGMSLPA